MGNVAQTYSALGRHSEALAMKKSVLKLRRHVLPADHPDIGHRITVMFGVLLHVISAD